MIKRIEATMDANAITGGSQSVVAQLTHESRTVVT